jgi:hypothetical protein
MRFDGKGTRLPVEYKGQEILLTTRCHEMFLRLFEGPATYEDLKQSEFDRADEIMYQLRKQLKAQGGPEIRTVRKGHYAYFEVVV